MYYNNLFEYILFCANILNILLSHKNFGFFFLFLSLQKEIKVNNYADRSQ